jgi:8-oxo-dGTP pyrophosphatase MutT (NUDIX family)
MRVHPNVGQRYELSALVCSASSSTPSTPSRSKENPFAIDERGIEPYIEHVRRRLAAHAVKENEALLKRASVLIPLFERNNELYVLMTKRSRHLNSHAGQMSFPGGKQDPTDRDSQETALRETHEEVGIEPSQVTIAGKLDQILSRKYHLVSPFVGFLQKNFTVREPTKVKARNSGSSSYIEFSNFNEPFLDR